MIKNISIPLHPHPHDICQIHNWIGRSPIVKEVSEQYFVECFAMCRGRRNSRSESSESAALGCARVC